MEIIKKDKNLAKFDLEFLFSPASEGFLKTLEEASKDPGSKVFSLSEVPELHWFGCDLSAKPRAYIEYLMQLNLKPEELACELERYVKH